MFCHSSGFTLNCSSSTSTIIFPKEIGITRHSNFGSLKTKRSLGVRSRAVHKDLNVASTGGSWLYSTQHALGSQTSDWLSNVPACLHMGGPFSLTILILLWLHPHWAGVTQPCSACGSYLAPLPGFVFAIFSQAILDARRRDSEWRFRPPRENSQKHPVQGGATSSNVQRGVI